MLENKNILLIISGGIAAYKSLELIRLFKKNGANVKCILTAGGSQFVTPMAVSALSENHVYTDLWSLKDEREMGHIQLSREADHIVVAPATANLMARIANGLADDLASTTVLASDKAVTFVPAMNHMMWHNAATQRNINTLVSDGAHIIYPAEGDMACGEHGIGRMQEPETILKSVSDNLSKQTPQTNKALPVANDVKTQQSLIPAQSHDNVELPLSGRHVLITAGPTFEPIDPVRFIGNRSSGKQGFAAAEVLAARGARVTLITGPTSLETPAGVNRIDVSTAVEMLAACETSLPADVGLFSAAVGDWTPEEFSTIKIKKKNQKVPPEIRLKENPDIVRTIATAQNRPPLIIGFAAETNHLLENARQKLTSKNCDWILANPVTQDSGQCVFGADKNHVFFVSATETEDWTLLSKNEVAIILADRIAKALAAQTPAVKTAS